MKNIFLLIDGKSRITLVDFIEVTEDYGICPMDNADLATIENLKVGERHMIANKDGWTEVKRVEEAI